MTPITVELTNSEMVIAAAVGAMRRIMNIRGKNPQKHGFKNGSWSVDIDSACAEMAVARHTRQYWNGAIGQLKAHDVGDLEVRHTPRADGCLIVHDDDHDEAPYILVTGSAPNFTIRGWAFGREAKRAEYWRDQGVPFPAFFMPQRYLRDIEELL